MIQCRLGLLGPKVLSVIIYLNIMLFTTFYGRPVNLQLNAFFFYSHGNQFFIIVCFGFDQRFLSEFAIFITRNLIFQGFLNDVSTGMVFVQTDCFDSFRAVFGIHAARDLFQIFNGLSVLFAFPILSIECKNQIHTLLDVCGIGSIGIQTFFSGFIQFLTEILT